MQAFGEVVDARVECFEGGGFGGQGAGGGGLGGHLFLLPFAFACVVLFSRRVTLRVLICVMRSER